MNEQIIYRGSEWRKWDLHIHTPASFHWNGGKKFLEADQGEQEQILQKMVDAINSSDVAVFAMTDYWTFDGYLKLKDFVKRNNIKLDKTVFPGMELRVEAPVNYRLNIQVILSDELTQQQLQDFKSKLKIASINRNLSDDALKDFARSLDDSKAKVCGFGSVSTLSDIQLLQLGAKTAEVTKESLCKDAFEAIPAYSGYILLPYDTSDGLKNLDWTTHPHDDNYFMQSADLFESRNDETVDLFLCRTTDKNKNFIKNFVKTIGGEPKPVVCGSDAHKIEDYGKYPNGRVTWIKADTTFLGLSQVINEPADRAYVGTLPDKLVEVNNHKSKYIDSIKITNTHASASPSWFSNELPLNNGLVAVIGKKGNGKSALADIISLCGDSKVSPVEYSFLKPNKFRKRGLARNYEATLNWLDSQKSKKNLDEDVQMATSVEKVKYLPQQYVENICNEDGVSTLFQQEIDKVIFSYVPEESRLGTRSLAELIKIKTESVDSSLLTARADLHRINERVTSLEDKENPEYLESLNKKLEGKNQDLKNLSKPKAIKKPKTTLSKVKENKINRLTSAILKVNGQIDNAREELKNVNNKLHKLNRIIDKISNLKEDIAGLIETFKEDAIELSIDLSKVINLKISEAGLITKQEGLLTEKEKLDNKLEQNNPKSKVSLLNNKTKLESQLESITETLGADQKLYEQYQKELKLFEERENAIEGKKGDTSLETIAGLETEIDFVKNKLSSALQEQYRKRGDAQKRLFLEIEKKIAFYQEVYTPLVHFIKSEEKTQKESGSVLNFSAGLIFDKQKFITNFFSFINQGKDGSFQTVVGGQKILNNIIEKFDLTKKDDVGKFVDDVIDHLKNDKTQITPKANLIKSQLKKDQVSFYDFLFGLDYLGVKYKILFNDKDLNANEFSPGEKGALLLIFYLLIDKDNVPLVIDQPEENLDNESVYTLLVPYIKKAKNRRQIIAITHNPNLAVVCDAEQVVCAVMDKKKNEIRYTSGSIEDPATNKKIVDILEGTLPAFTVRDRKYIRKKINGSKRKNSIQFDTSDLAIAKLLKQAELKP